jgi:hypothetical protein
MNNAELESRLETIERRLSRYRLISVLLGLALVGLAGIAANAPSETTQEIRARRVVIVDEKGRETGHMTSGPNGGLLSLMNNEAIPVIRMGAGEKGGKITVLDAKGNLSIVASSEETGGELALQDKKGQKNLMRAATGRQEK